MKGGRETFIKAQGGSLWGGGGSIGRAAQGRDLRSTGTSKGRVCLCGKKKKTRRGATTGERQSLPTFGGWDTVTTRTRPSGGMG